jgi:hypothetical protein
MHPELLFKITRCIYEQKAGISHNEVNCVVQEKRTEISWQYGALIPVQLDTQHFLLC